MSKETSKPVTLLASEIHTLLHEKVTKHGLTLTECISALGLVELIWQEDYRKQLYLSSQKEVQDQEQSHTVRIIKPEGN